MILVCNVGMQRQKVVTVLDLLYLLAYSNMLGKEGLLFRSYFLFCISLWFLAFPVVLSQIPLGSKLSVEEDNYWLSSNGDFAIGFFDCSKQYSIGIQFSSNAIPISEQTVVWVAGGNLKVGTQSYFELNQNGNLVLFDSTSGVIAWTSETSNASVASAVLHNNGNLILLNRNDDIVWQSFDTPSDTLLPGQNLSVYQTLRPGSRNSVSSYFSLYMDVSGQLRLRYETSVIYWTNGNPSQSILRAILSPNGSLQLLDHISRSVWSVFGEDHDDSDVKFRFLRLDADGNLRLYSWLEASKTWRSVWQAVANQCQVFATCGLRGFCSFNSSGTHLCKCPFTSTGESNSDCLVPYQQDCTSGSSMIAYDHTLVYGIYPPNKTITQNSLQQCKRSCQNDPLCTAVTFTNDGTGQCWMTSTEYISGYSDDSLSAISFVKTCSDPIAAVLPIIPKSTTSSPQASPLKRSQKLCVPCLVGLAIGTLVAFVVIQFGIGFCIFRKRKYARKKAALAYMVPNPKDFNVLSYTEIKDLTENFKYQIGPRMFKGVLPNNRPVAVKDLNATIEDRKFRSSVLKIANIYHKNLVKLEGYCCESGHRILVYEFAKHGSLEKCLEDPKMCKRLTWRKRMEICLAVGRAIFYLHTECREFINHGNLKCENVVLDENLEAKVSEFGLESVLGEASSSGRAAERDVGDFGKMVIVLFSGCQIADNVYESAYEKWLTGQGGSLVDKRIEGEMNLEELERALRIAFWCLQVDERMRPSMGEVVKVLEGTLTVDPPPSPFTCQWPLNEEEPSGSYLEP